MTTQPRRSLRDLITEPANTPKYRKINFPHRPGDRVMVKYLTNVAKRNYRTKRATVYAVMDNVFTVQFRLPNGNTYLESFQKSDLLTGDVVVEALNQ